MDSIFSTSPEQFNKTLELTEDKFLDNNGKPAIPAVITFNLERFITGKVRRLLKNGNKLSVFIVRAPRFPIQGTPNGYIVESANHGTWIFFIANGTRYTVPFDSIANVEIKRSEYMTSEFELRDDSPNSVINREQLIENACNRFLKFLDSLERTEKDKNLIESVKKAYISCVKVR